MSSAQAISAPAPTLLDRIRRPESIVMILGLAVPLVALFWNWLYTQHLYSKGSGDWSHAYLVPVISGYLLWQHKDALGRVPSRAFWPGLVPVLLGVVTYAYFIVGVPNHMGQGFALVLTVFGLTLLIAGPRVMNYTFFAIAYLLFAITISERIMIGITFRMQQWAAMGAYFTLNIIGVETFLKGNQLEVMSEGRLIPLNVAQACSGMRMLIAFIALGAAVALVATRQWWKRVVILALSVPIALMLNVIRVVVLGIAATYKQDLAAGEAHSFIGTLLLIPGFVLFMGVVWALNRAVSEADEQEAAA